MKEVIDNTEVERVLAKLEELEDESLAVELLKEFNDATREHGQLLLNKDQNLDHEEWKKQCDQAQKRVESVVSKINEL
jgi:divalent metal cation (Fe/Co/Zn/Cd) transporter